MSQTDLYISGIKEGEIHSKMYVYEMQDRYLFGFTSNVFKGKKTKTTTNILLLWTKCLVVNFVKKKCM